MKTPVVLVVGTTHPLNVAGIGLDARIAALLGVRIVTVVAGVSAQNAASVLARTAIDAAMIAAQFEALRDVPIDAIHVGALVDAQSVRAVARALPGLVSVPIVCDPVITATTGDRLADDATVAALRDELFAHCTVVTPNLDEAGQLLGRAIVDEESMEGAARELLKTGAGAVLLKGGHLAGPASDILVDRSGVVRFVGDRIETTLRGTGDLLACAIAARFADGEALVPSVESARSFVRGCLAAGVPFAGTRTIP